MAVADRTVVPSSTTEGRDGAVAAALRRGVLWLTALTLVGVAVELAVARHWTKPSQIIAWVAVLAAAVAVALVLRRPTARRVHLARFVAVLVSLSALFGVRQHVEANYDVAPLDGRYTATWDSLSEPERWWLAASKTVGPSPPLAPGALAQAAFAVLLATLRHPAIERRPTD